MANWKIGIRHEALKSGKVWHFIYLIDAVSKVKLRMGGTVLHLADKMIEAKKIAEVLNG